MTIAFNTAAQYDLEIVRGQDWTWVIRVIDEKPILSSTAATPTVLTVTNHGLNTAATVYVQDHLVNTNANTSSGVAITKVDANRYSLNAVAGNGVGIKTGTAGAAVDLTGYTVKCDFRAGAKSGTLIASPAFAWLDQAQGKFSLSLSSAQTAAITADRCFYDVWLVKSGATQPVASGAVKFIDGVSAL